MIPDCLVAGDLAALIDPTGNNSLRLARNILVFAETGSTNDVVSRMAGNGEAEGVVVFAERQTAGRGRLGRRWESALHKGLWFSMLLRPALAFSNWSRLTTWVAVGVARGLEEALPGCRASVKWPNDIYLNGRKAAGILIECSAGPNGYAVAGIGVNVNHSRSDFPEELITKATSLREASASAGELDRQKVAAALLRQLDALYGQLSGNFAAVVAEAEARSILIGREIEMQGVDVPLRGIAEGLEPDGRLRVRGEDGSVRLVSGGEVSISGWK